jgi:exodeoxyribonuclease V alpha subunit
VRVPKLLDQVAPSHIDLHHMAMPQTPRTSTPTEVLTGLVERVTFHNEENGFCVLRVKARGQRDLVTVLGHAAMIAAGEFVQASGTWVNDRTHGVLFGPPNHRRYGQALVEASQRLAAEHR